MGWMAMDRRHIRGFNAAAKEELWDRRQRGESLKAIGNQAAGTRTEFCSKAMFLKLQ
jgi:hypothetical protein